MDPLNKEYDKLTELVDEMKTWPVNKLYEYFTINYEVIRNLTLRLSCEDRKLLSYSNTNRFMFLKALVLGTKCAEPGCGKSYGFGYDEKYCDTCVEKHRCDKPFTCKFQVGKYPAVFCPHSNFALLNSGIKYWIYSMNEKRPETYGPRSRGKAYFYCPSCTHPTNLRLKDSDRNIFCQYCAAGSKELCKDKTCKLCEDKSFFTSKNAHM